MLNQAIMLYQLTHTLISPYKKSTEKLYKLDNAEVVCVIPDLDASPSVDDGIGSKTELEGVVEIKLNDGVNTTKKDVNVIVCSRKYIHAHAVNHFNKLETVVLLVL